MTSPFGGYGVGPFGIFAFGMEYEEPLSQVRGQLTSSRLITGAGTFGQVDDATGAFAGMPDTAQRVLLLLSTLRSPRKIVGSFATSLEAEVRRVLRPLTIGREPAIRIVSVDYLTERDITSTRVRYVDLVDGRTKIATAAGTTSDA